MIKSTIMMQSVYGQFGRGILWSTFGLPFVIKHFNSAYVTVCVCYIVLGCVHFVGSKTMMAINSSGVVKMITMLKFYIFLHVWLLCVVTWCI